MSPRYCLFSTHLDHISDVLAALHDVNDVEDWSPKGVVNCYWDGALSLYFTHACRLCHRALNTQFKERSCIDYCLAHFLRGVVLRLIAHPAPHTKAKPLKSPIPLREADEQAMISFK